MRTITLAAAFALTAGAALAADPIEGIWQTQPDEGAFAHVTVAPCGGAFCGTISRTFQNGSEYRSPNLGRQIVIDMAPQGNGDYSGKVWRPANDKIYNGKASVAGGLICKSQTWARVR